MIRPGTLHLSVATHRGVCVTHSPTLEIADNNDMFVAQIFNDLFYLIFQPETFVNLACRWYLPGTA